MRSRWWNRFLDFSEPAVLVLIRVCGWSSIFFVFAIFFFIFSRGAPFLVNKLRYEDREAHFEEESGAGTLAFRATRPAHRKEMERLLEKCFANGAISGVNHAWISSEGDLTIRVDFAADRDPRELTEAITARLATFAAERDHPRELTLASIPVETFASELIFVTPYRKPQSSIHLLSAAKKDGKLEKARGFWADFSNIPAGRVLIELAPGATPAEVTGEIEASIPTRALVLSSLPVEKPEEIAIEELHEAIHDGEITGATRVSLEAIAGGVFVVVDIERDADPEAVAKSMLAAVPMRTSATHMLSFFTSAEWRPDSQSAPQFGILALIMGTFSVTLLAAVFAVPLSLGTAVFISEFCAGKVKEGLKILIELLAAIPSVVWGFIGYMIMNPIIIAVTGRPIGINMLNGGIVLAFMSIPIMVSLAEDAFKAVPESYREAAAALGASRWQVVYRILFPAAKNGLLAACLLGMGRALGETMAVLMVTGHAVNMPTSIFDSVRTMTATIAAELGEAPEGGHHYQALFVIGMVLMVLATTVNLVSDLIVKGVRGKQNA